MGGRIERAHAYVADGDVYFAVRSDLGYGRLSHRDLDEMDQGEGLEGSERQRAPGPGPPRGAGPAGLAHRMLGDGRAAAGRGLRGPRRRVGPDLSPPRERG